MSQENTHTGHADEHASMSKAAIWKVFFILLGLTVVEFVIALAIPLEVMAKPIKDVVYIALTIVKAYYIVAYFMHLKFEKPALIISILVSFVFIIYFIVLMLTEGSYIHDSLAL